MLVLVSTLKFCNADCCMWPSMQKVLIMPQCSICYISLHIFSEKVNCSSFGFVSTPLPSVFHKPRPPNIQMCIAKLKNTTNDIPIPWNVLNMLMLIKPWQVLCILFYANPFTNPFWESMFIKAVNKGHGWQPGCCLPQVT